MSKKLKLHPFGDENSILFSILSIVKGFPWIFNETWWILVEMPSQNTMWDSHTNLSLFKSNLTEPMGSDQFSVWMCVFSLLDLNIGQARFYFLTNVNSLKYVFNFKFLVHKNMFISYDHWYTHQLVKPIDHSKGRLVQVFPWSETLGVLWHKKEK